MGHSTLEMSGVQLCSVTEISLVVCEQKPYLLWFTCRIAIAIPQYSVNTAIKKEHDLC